MRLLFSQRRADHMKPKPLFIADGSVTVVLGVIFVVLPGLALSILGIPPRDQARQLLIAFLGAALSFHPPGRPHLDWCVRFGSTPVSAGGAGFWSEGEMHETGTDSGMMAIVVETAALVDDEHLGPVR